MSLSRWKPGCDLASRHLIGDIRMNQLAVDFLTRCFHPGETIALLLRREVPAFATQRIVTLERAVAPRYLNWLGHENGTGVNVYVAANPLRPGSQKRTKDSIAS